MDDIILLRWMHECFTSACSPPPSVIVRHAKQNAGDDMIEVPNMYCPRSGMQLRLLQMGERKI